MTIIREDNVKGRKVWAATDGKTYRVFVDGTMKHESNNVDATVTIYQMTLVMVDMGII